ncbi:alkene reductase [Glutamicibacter sp.]|uniref:alkene reductase n=1 Tax=Glutamicibacter sp. TaxID=1931995 RepID=UPI002B489B41|nr:alkene reductase [Glutamicibacter sp.]HJX78346.1 alkene reductase [Glutamicibacter sp.]
MDLFSPLALGDLKLSNRLVMAPLTRSRSGKDGVPNTDVVEYYRQRASLGLIVSEGVYPSAAGQGFVRQPGLVTAEQVAGWKKVTDAVHAEGGLIVAQVMHAGRVTHPETTGVEYVEAPSAIAVEGQSRTYTGKYDYPVPHALASEELPRIIEEFVTASRNAIAAGFDGVELHGANGYLLHEFLAPTSNTRTDLYGGSPENRARFVIEMVTAVANAIGAGKTGLRISPEHNIQSAIESDREDVTATYSALLEGVAPLGLAALSILHHDPAGELVQGLRKAFGGPVLLNTGFGEITTYQEAARVAAEGWGEAVVVGRPAIANPDLVRRWRDELPLNEPDAATFYTEGPQGYTDYPFWAN